MRPIMREMPASLVIRLPDPCLVVLVGAAGAGKSTFARRHFGADEILSSDAFRGLVSGDPTDQRATKPAFAALHRVLRERLRQRRLTVVDATNVTTRARTALLRQTLAAGLPAIAIVLDLPADLVLARNRARGDRRAVPDAAVRAHLADLARTLADDRLAREGFGTVWRITSAVAVDGTVVVREPLGR
jgi:protein phosphatase